MTTTTRPLVRHLVVDQLRYCLQDLWRARAAFVFTFLFPLTWLVVVGFLAGNDTLDPSTGVRVMQFITPVAMTMGVLYATYPTVATSVAVAREQGVLKRVRSTPLPVWVYLAGRIGASVVFAVGAVATMVAVGVVAYGVQLVPRTAVATTVTLLMAIACFAALGLAFASVAPSASVAQAGSIASAVVLSFLSGLYTIGEMPEWVTRIAAVFPLQPLNAALKEQFDPFHTGAGWDVPGLLVIAGWGIAGVVVAARTFRWEPTPGLRHGRTTPTVDGQPPADRPARTRSAPPRWTSQAAHPTRLTLLLEQVRWANLAAWRDPGWVFFAVALPVGLFAFTMAVGTPGAVGRDGIPAVLAAAAGMTAWGAAVTAFINLPEAVARSRERGVLKRLRGTPTTPGLFLAGRTVSALLIALVTGVLVVTVGIAAFGLRASWTGVPLAAAILLLGTVTMSACGFALMAVVRTSKAMAAVALAVLLPLSFFSDIFVSGVPEWMSTVGAFFPLKHVADSLTIALDPAGPSVSWPALGVITAWLGVATAMAVLRFRWSPDPQ